MAQSKRLDLSIIIPALNEEKRIGTSLDSLADYLKHDDFFASKEVEVLVVAADASDKTHEIALSKRPLFQHFQLLQPGPSRGKGHAVRYGMLQAQGIVAIFMDADLATPLHHLNEFYAICTSGTDVVIGTRNPSKYRLGSIRRLVSNTGNALFRVAGGMWLEDSQCGFKMFNARASRLCFSKMTIEGWGFDMEILTIAKVNGFHIKHFRLDDWQDMPDSTFSDGTVKNSIRSLGELAKIVSNRVKGTYIESSKGRLLL